MASSNSVFALGAAGHETVCEIAFNELTAKAKTAVLEIMKNEEDERFKTFRDACVWPDYPALRLMHVNQITILISLETGITSNMKNVSNLTPAYLQLSDKMKAY